jgi:hypothetical protein
LTVSVLLLIGALGVTAAAMSDDTDPGDPSATSAPADPTGADLAPLALALQANSDSGNARFEYTAAGVTFGGEVDWDAVAGHATLVSGTFPVNEMWWDANGAYAVDPDTATISLLDTNSAPVIGPLAQVVMSAASSNPDNPILLRQSGATLIGPTDQGTAFAMGGVTLTVAERHLVSVSVGGAAGTVATFADFGLVDTIESPSAQG